MGVVEDLSVHKKFLNVSKQYDDFKAAKDML